MSWLTEHAEIDETPDGVHQTIYSAQEAFFENGSLRRNQYDFADSGNSLFPHHVRQAPVMMSVGSDGVRRIHPTREDDVYIEVGAPFVKMGGVWTKINLGLPVRNGNRLTWSRDLADMTIDFGGHTVKLGILFKNNFMPEGREIAFPVGIQGLTRSGRNLLKDGLPIMYMAPSYIQDLANLENSRQVATNFATIDGQAYVHMVLPVCSDMAQPYLDPVFSSQPTAASGEDTSLIAGGNANANFGIKLDGLQQGMDAATNIYRGLVKIPITTLPAKIYATVGTLTLYCESELDTTNRLSTVYRSLVQWYEGNQNGLPPAGGENGSTWNHRNVNGSVTWSVAGGAAGTEWGSVFTAQITVTGIGSFAYNVLADINLFLTGTDYYGWWLLGSEISASSLKRMAPSDATTASRRPKLDITYNFLSFDAMYRGNMQGAMRGAR